MDYRKFLGKEESLVLPYLGGSSVDAPGRRLRVARVQAPLEPGWWRFRVKGRDAAPAEKAEPQGLEALPGVRGHLALGRLVHDRAVAEPVHCLPEEEPPLLAPCRARRWHSGELVFDQIEFEGEAEEAARHALEENGTLAQVKGIPASLRAAFGYAVMAAASGALGIPASPIEVRAHILDVAERGRPAAEAILRRLDEERDGYRRAREALERAAEAQRTVEQAQRAAERERARIRHELRRAGPGRGATESNADARAEAALEGSGARLLGTRSLGGGNLEVTFRFMGERFISVVQAITMQVQDAGICLAGADREVTLDSLPAVIREAIDGGRLVITRRG